MKRKLIYLLALFTIIVQTGFSQGKHNVPVDSMKFQSTPVLKIINSLKKKLAQHPEEDTVRAWMLVYLGAEYNEIDPDTSLIIADEILRISKKLNWQKGIDNALLNKGDAYTAKNDYPRALDFYLDALKNCQLEKDTNRTVYTYLTIARFYGIQMNNDLKAVQYAKLALKLNEIKGQKSNLDKKQHLLAITLLGQVYSKTKMRDSAKYYLLKSEEFAKEQGNTYNLASIYQNLSILFNQSGKYLKGLDYSFKALKIAEKLEDKTSAAICYNTIGESYKNLAIHGISQNADPKLAAKYSVNKKEMIRLAKEYTEKSLSFAKKTGNLQGLANDYDLLSNIQSELLGDYKGALASYKKSVTYRDSITNLQKDKKLVQKTMQFKQEKKDAIARTKLKKQKLLRNVFIGGFIVVLIFLFIFFRQLRKTRKQRERAERSERQKQRFFTNISHEFRTPLTLLIGPLEDLMRGGSVEKFKTILPEMHRNSKRLLRLINQLLDISKLDAEKYNVNPTREGIIPFTEQIVHSFSSLAQSRDIALDMTADAELANRLATPKTHFYFDEDVIEKIITNLLSNAFKYTPEQGSIAVSLSIAEEHPDSLLLKVQDSGAGISEEVLAHIFDRFYQVENQYPQRAGSGIGLALVKELVEVHGGKISVKSREGAGATFYCLFPLNKKGTVTRQQPSPWKKIEPVPDEEADNFDVAAPMDKPGDDGKPVVLVVEDQQDVRKYICSQLKEQYEVLEAQNGRQGLQVALEHLPALVISDVMMPEMDGFALCKALKTDKKTSHIPVILLTARAEDGDKMTGLETGADAYLIKPFNAKELLVRVRNLITSRNKMRAKFSGSLFVKPAEITVTSLDRELMDKLLKTVDTHIEDTTFSVDDLSEAVNMSTRQLNRKLKAIIDQSPLQFIRSVRLQRALEMLKNNSGNISEIAFKTGFETPSYFTKRFKEQFGCLPSEKEKFPG